MSTATQEKHSLLEVVETVKELCSQEDAILHELSPVLWAMGDYLLAQQLDKGDLAEVAQQVRRTVGTLNARINVAREFPPDIRDTRHAWSVYRVLARLPKDKRQGILNGRPTWTIDTITDVVGSELGADLSDTTNTREVKTRAGMKLGSFVITGTLSADGRTITLASESLVESVEAHNLGPAGLVIVVEPIR